MPLDRNEARPRASEVKSALVAGGLFLAAAIVTLASSGSWRHASALLVLAALSGVDVMVGRLNLEKGARLAVRVGSTAVALTMWWLVAT